MPESSSSSPASAGPLSSREFELEPQDNERLANLCGPLDENLRLIESRLGVEIRRRGSAFRVLGPRAGAAEALLRELFRLSRTEEVSPESVHLALRDHEHADAGSAVGEGETEQAEDPVIRVLRGSIRARGPNQREYLRRMQRHDLTFGVGPAGTGKTYLAVACAVEALQADRVRRIVLVRPAVEAGERLGFLPGDLTQKVDPYLRPMYDALYTWMSVAMPETITAMIPDR